MRCSFYFHKTYLLHEVAEIKQKCFESRRPFSTLNTSLMIYGKTNCLVPKTFHCSLHSWENFYDSIVSIYIFSSAKRLKRLHWYKCKNVRRNAEGFQRKTTVFNWFMNTTVRGLMYFNVGTSCQPLRTMKYCRTSVLSLSVVPGCTVLDTVTQCRAGRGDDRARRTAHLPNPSHHSSTFRPSRRTSPFSDDVRTNCRKKSLI